jgi:hypothetical protein
MHREFKKLAWPWTMILLISFFWVTSIYFYLFKCKMVVVRINLVYIYCCERVGP